MGLGDVSGATDRAEGVILSRSLDDVEDGVRFTYVLRPSLGGRIAVTDDVGGAVSVTVDDGLDPAQLSLSEGAIAFEVSVTAGSRTAVALIAHDVTVAGLSIADPTVERRTTDASESDRPSGVFDRLSGLFGGASGAAASGSDEESETDTTSGAPIDTAALEALSEDVPDSPAAVVEGARGSEPDEEAPESTSESRSSSSTAADTHNGSAGGSGPSVETDSTGRQPLSDSEVESDPGDDDPDSDGNSVTDEDTDGSAHEADSTSELSIPDAPDEGTLEGSDSPEPRVPSAADSVLADLIAELRDDDHGAAHRAALREALDLQGVTAEDIDDLRERQLAIRDALEDLRTRTRETRQSQRALERELQETAAALESVRDEVSTLHRGCSVLEEQFTGFVDRLEGVESEIETIEDIEALRADLERAESQREQLTQGLTAVDDRVDDLAERRTRLEERLETLENTLQDLEAFRSSLARAFDRTGGREQSGSSQRGPGGR